MVVTSAQSQVLPDGLAEVLKNQESVIVYSIAPNREPGEPAFLGYPVLGRLELNGQEAQVLSQALLAGLREAKSSDRGDCFAPRHALESSGYRLLICYACSNVLCESPDGERHDLAITKMGNEEFASAVMKAGLPWQGWALVNGRMRHQSGLSVKVPYGYRAEGSAVSETLYLESERQAVQSIPVPGEVVLRGPDGREERLSTRWLDHSESGKAVSYLVGLSTRFESSSNLLLCEGSSFELAQIKDYFAKADRPAQLSARIRLTPVNDETALSIQKHRLRRAGYKLEPRKSRHGTFESARARRRRVDMEATVGQVETPFGKVMISAEVPVGWENPVWGFGIP